MWVTEKLRIAQIKMHILMPHNTKKKKIEKNRKKSKKMVKKPKTVADVASKDFSIALHICVLWWAASQAYMQCIANSSAAPNIFEIFRYILVAAKIFFFVEEEKLI